jgi:hypothetical protein
MSAPFQGFRSSQLLLTEDFVLGYHSAAFQAGGGGQQSSSRAWSVSWFWGPIRKAKYIVLTPFLFWSEDGDTLTPNLSRPGRGSIPVVALDVAMAAAPHRQSAETYVTVWLRLCGRKSVLPDGAMTGFFRFSYFVVRLRRSGPKSGAAPLVSMYSSSTAVLAGGSGTVFAVAPRPEFCANRVRHRA